MAKRGRPKKKENVKHSFVLPPVRCTELELFQIKNNALAQKMSLSGYIREVAINGEVQKIERKTPYDPGIVYQLKRIGSNLNQITRIMHQEGVIPIDCVALKKDLEIVLDQLLKSQLHDT